VDREEVDADLQPEPDRARPCHLDQGGRAAELPTVLDAALAQEPELDQLVHQPRDARAVQPRLIRDRRARTRPVLDDEPEHGAEVAVAYRSGVRWIDVCG
jgi:hypothetical protein